MDNLMARRSFQEAEGGDEDDNSEYANLFDSMEEDMDEDFDPEMMEDEEEITEEEMAMLEEMLMRYYEETGEMPDLSSLFE